MASSVKMESSQTGKQVRSRNHTPHSNSTPEGSKIKKGPSNRSGSETSPPDSTWAEADEDLSSSWFSRMFPLLDQIEWRMFAETYGISTLFHVLLLLILAMIVLHNGSKTPLPDLYSSVRSPEMSDLEVIEEITITEEQPSVNDDVPMQNLEDLGVPDVPMTSPLASIKIGESLSSTKELSKGLGKLSFFGTRSEGKRFVFVVDNSNSMTKGRFETACYELVQTVEKMNDKQKFYVIFFSDTAYPMFYPKPATQLIPASASNKQRLKLWLRSVELCLRTQGLEAVQLAQRLKPDVIYILGDGAFTDKTTEYLTGPGRSSIPIHMLGMEVQQKGEAQFQAIAKVNKGSYKDVGVHAAMRKQAKEKPIKRNNVRGRIWGIKLPPTKKKKM